MELEQAVRWAREMAQHHGMDGRTCAALLAEIEQLRADRDRLLARCDELDAYLGDPGAWLTTAEIRALLGEDPGEDEHRGRMSGSGRRVPAGVAG